MQLTGLPPSTAGSSATADLVLHRAVGALEQVPAIRPQHGEYRLAGFEILAGLVGDDFRDVARRDAFLHQAGPQGERLQRGVAVQGQVAVLHQGLAHGSNRAAGRCRRCLRSARPGNSRPAGRDCARRPGWSWLPWPARSRSAAPAGGICPAGPCDNTGTSRRRRPAARPACRPPCRPRRRPADSASGTPRGSPTALFSGTVQPVAANCAGRMMSSNSTSSVLSFADITVLRYCACRSLVAPPSLRGDLDAGIGGLEAVEGLAHHLGAQRAGDEHVERGFGVGRQRKQRGEHEQRAGGADHLEFPLVWVVAAWLRRIGTRRKGGVKAEAASGKPR